MHIKNAEKAAVLLAILMVASTAVVSSAAGARRSAVPVEVSALSPTEPSGSPNSDGLVDINTADLDALCTLHGIGPGLAQRIIDYRETNGLFSNIADIIDVSGIGLKTFEDIKDKITI